MKNDQLQFLGQREDPKNFSRENGGETLPLLASIFFFYKKLDHEGTISPKFGGTMISVF
jgi:hypothetical protein